MTDPVWPSVVKYAAWLFVSSMGIVGGLALVVMRVAGG